MKKLFILVSSSLLFECCYDKNCSDLVYPEITQKELEMLPKYEYGDTLSFKNLKTGIIYEARCVYRKLDTRFMYKVSDIRCEVEGYWLTFDRLIIELNTNLPYTGNISFHYYTRTNEGYSIYFAETSGIALDYDRKKNILFSTSTDQNLSVNFLNETTIDNNIFHNVYLVTGSLGYDSIYFNGEYGFLRLVDIDRNLDYVLLL